MTNPRAQMRQLSDLELQLVIQAARNDWAGKYRMNYAWEAAVILAERERNERA